MGIGKPLHKGEVSSFVLAPFSQEETKYLDKWISSAADAILKLETIGFDDVSSQYSLKHI
jgi:peptidyl-tRNA hydrolase